MNVMYSMSAGKRSLTSLVLTCILSFFLSGSATAQNSQSFYLIAGSFNNLESAREGLSQIESTYGRKPELLFPDSQSNSRRYRVSVYRSNSKNEVNAYANSLKDRGLKPGWVLEMKKPALPSNLRKGSVATQRLSQDSYARNGVETYYLITGSFQSFDQADRDRLEKIEKGFESEILFPEDTESGSYKVSVFYSTSRKQIDSYAALLKRKGINGWIYTAAADEGMTRGNSNAKIVKASAPAVSTSSSNKTFHIVGGSFKQFEQASTFTETMKMKGITPKIIFPDTDGGYFRVSVFSSSNRAAVDARNAQLKKEGKVTKGWVLVE